MSNLFGNFSRNSSHRNMSMMENDLKIMEKKYLKFWKSVECINRYFRTIYQKLEHAKTRNQRNLQNRNIWIYVKFLIKISENTHSIGWETKTNELWNSKDLKPLRKKFKALHIGAVQFAVEPLTRLGFRSPFVSVS